MLRSVKKSNSKRKVSQPTSPAQRSWPRTISFNSSIGRYRSSARPLKEGEGKGADRGVDGLLYYYETERKDLINRIKEDAPAVRSEPVHREKIIVQVKGGGVNRGDAATLLGDVENQKAAGGVLVTLEKPTKQMRTEAADAGRYTSKLWHDKDYPRLQILTIEGLLNGTERIDAPPQLNPFAMAARELTPHRQNGDDHSISRLSNG